MADRELQDILDSGEIASAYFGGTSANKKVQLAGFDNSATSLIATTVQTALVELANVGLAHMTLVTPYSAGQTIGTSPIKISLFDTIHHSINGALTPVVDTSEATPAHSFTVIKDGLYSIYGTVTAEFASADAVSLILYKNGSPISPNVELQGRGASKPVMYAYTDLVDLVATDVLEIYAVSTASTSVVITASSMIVERKPLS